MFALHSTLTTEELAADKKASAAALRRGLNPFPSRSVSIVQAAQIKYFEEHYTYPAVPGSELCMKYPAIVVAEWGIDFEGALFQVYLSENIQLHDCTPCNLY